MKANKLGLWSIVFLGINGIIGSGVFLLPNKAMDLFGPYSLLILLFDMVLVLCISLCFAEASSLFKDTGGPYIYAKEAFGDFIGYEVGFLVWATRIIAFSTMSVGFATALAGIVPEWNTVFMKNVISCGVVVVLSLMNLLGVKPFKIIQNIATIGKLVPLVLFVGIGVFIIDFDNFVAPPDTVYTTTTFGSCAILLFYAFTGFESICVAAGDMDNPTKNVPKATIITIAIVSIIYFLLLAVCIGVMGESLAESTVPVQEAFTRICGPVGGVLIAAGTLVSIGGICIMTSFVMPRNGLALAEKGMLPCGHGPAQPIWRSVLVHHRVGACCDGGQHDWIVHYACGHQRGGALYAVHPDMSGRHGLPKDQKGHQAFVQDSVRQYDSNSCHLDQHRLFLAA